MKEFFAFVRKEFLHIFRDRKTLLVLVGLPTVLIVLFGFAISTEIRNVNIGLLSMDDDISITRLMQKIDRSEYFTYVGKYASEAEVDEAMRRGEIDAALIFPAGFIPAMFGAEGAEVALVTSKLPINRLPAAIAILSCRPKPPVLAVLRQTLLPATPKLLETVG